MDLNQENLWSILEIGDRSVQKLRKKVYMIVGLTKNGKSCLFNHLLGRPMIGKQDDLDQQRIIYVPKTLGQTYAEMGSAASSTTLAPNIADISNGFSLIDMLGFQQNRDQKSTICVSYFLSSCFDRTDTVKFLVVISQENLFSKKIDLICGSFNDLVNMLTISKFDQVLKKKFFDSISLVITSATRDLEYLKTRIRTIIKQLEDPKLQTIKNRQIIRQILQKINNSQRVELFEQAKQNKQNGISMILQNLDNRGWLEFNILEAKKIINEPVIKISFKEDMLKLQGTQFADRFKKNINQKVDNILSINNIFQIYLKELRQNWMGQNIQDLYTYNVSEFIQKVLNYRMYNMDAIHKRNIDIPTNKSQDIFKIVQKSIELYDYKLELQNLCESIQNLSFSEQMNRQASIYSKMISCLIPVFTSKLQLQNLIRVRFCLQRSFKQFIKFNQLDQQMIKTITRNMNDQLSFQIPKRQHLEVFINTLDKQTLKSYFKTIQELDSLENLLQLYKKIVVKEKLDNDWFTLKYLKMKLTGKELKDKIYRNQHKKSSIVKNQVQMGQIYAQLFNLFKKRNIQCPSNKMIKQFVEEYHQIKISHFQKQDDQLIASKQIDFEKEQASIVEATYYQIVRIVNTIIQQIQNHAYIQTVLGDLCSIKLCELTKNPTLADQILTKKLIQQKEIQKKVHILRIHVEHCLKWGWLQQASKLLLLKRAYHLKEREYSMVKQTNHELKNLQFKQPSKNEAIQRIENFFSEDELKNIIQYLQKIDLAIKFDS